MNILLISILLPGILAFALGIIITPLITHFLYKHKVWKKNGGKTALGGKEATVFNQIKGKDEHKTPRMGGIVIWSSILLTLGIGFLLGLVFPNTFLAELDFLSRSQTLIPVTMLMAGAALGFLNDFYDVTRAGRGVRLSRRLMIISILAAALGWWFYAKLEVSTINLPGNAPLDLGILIVVFYILLTLVIYASGVIDGIDGLSGGVFAAIFAAYTGVSLINGQYDLAAFCATTVGALLAFLWFNIPPARFWMTETGSMALTLALATVVFMTDSLGEGSGIALFFIIGLPLLATVTSNVIQLLYRKATGGKKLFQIAPLHHHFEAIGWPSYKVTMRYWIISIALAVIGVTLAAAA